MTDDTLMRRNSDGDPCPPWCITDHHSSGDACVGSGTIGMYLGPVWARAIIGDHGPRVTVSGLASGPAVSAYVEIKPRDAVDLAAIVELLADMAPADVRQLAAAIRQAATAITTGRN